MKHQKSLQKAVKIIGGQAALARLLSTKKVPVVQQNVWYWLNKGDLPPKYAAKIEAATEGKVTRKQLCPDVFV